MEMNTKYRKQEMREKIKRKRSQLDSVYMQSAEQQIARYIIESHEFQQAKTVFCFVSMKGEIDTIPILEEALRLKKRLVVPKCLKCGYMEAYEITSLSQLETGYWGIQEPVGICEQISKEEIDFAIVPCLTCNLEGQRLGYGGGFYDCYLQGRDYAAAVICLEKLLEKRLELDEWDQVVDMVVTEKGVKKILVKIEEKEYL